MDESELLETLVASDVLTELNDGTIQVSDTFESAVGRYRTTVTDDATDVTALLTEVGTPPEHVSGLVSVGAADAAFLARYLAVRDMAATLAFSEAIRVLVLLDQLTEPASETAGTPDPFLPIRGERLPAMLTVFPLSVVYVWREQCPDCDVMRDALETVFEDGSDQFTLLSVYGPECAALLEDRYEVVGGPTTLFVVGGEVDCRLQGAHVEDVIETEIENATTTAEMRGVR